MQQQKLYWPIFPGTATAYSYVPDFEETEKMVELVQSYRELCNSIDRVASRPFEPHIDVQADDYPVCVVLRVVYIVFFCLRF